MRSPYRTIALAGLLLAAGCQRDPQAERSQPKAAIDDREHPEMRVEERLREGYSKLYSCRFQTELMNGGPQKPVPGYGDQVAAAIKADPAAGDKCLKALADRQGLTPAQASATKPK